MFWVLIILLLNGIAAFAYTVSHTADTSTVWGILLYNFLFFLGITQAGVVFSAVMRIARSEWGRYFARLGEILTLSFAPVAFIVFLILYFGGTDHLFYWAASNSGHAGQGHGGHISPWVGRSLLFWKNFISMIVFYSLSLLYFYTGRLKEKNIPVTYDIDKRLNITAALTLVAFILVNTGIAWDFGMTIIPHWESSIFPPFFWIGNVLAGIAFLFIMAVFFIACKEEGGMKRIYLDSIGKVLLGFTLFWMYLFWSQYIVIWYGNLPNLTKPVFKIMSGNYAPIFTCMLLAIFVIPFLTLIWRGIKLSSIALSIIALLLCVGVYINRYLMIIPVFSDGGSPVFATWPGVSLLLAGLSATLLSLLLFFKIFPKVSVSTR